MATHEDAAHAPVAATPGAGPASRGYKPFLIDFLSGGGGGICLVLAGHPFDLVKTRLQTMTPGADGKMPYKGAIDCVRQTLAADGVRGLYRGISTPLLGITPIFSICFLAYGAAKDFLRSYYGYTSESQLSLHQIGVAGALSAIPTTAIMAPGERIKVILQVQSRGKGAAAAGTAAPGASSTPFFKGPIDVVRHLGFSSLFKGSTATLLRDGTGSYAYFAVYEYIKRTLTPVGQSLSPVAVIVGGGFAGVCNWLVALPFDVVKSRIQVNIAAGQKLRMYAVAAQVIRENGVLGLYKGIGPALLRAFPANAAAFTGMEQTKKFLNSVLGEN